VLNWRRNKGMEQTVEAGAGRLPGHSGGGIVWELRAEVAEISIDRRAHKCRCIAWARWMRPGRAGTSDSRAIEGALLEYYGNDGGAERQIPIATASWRRRLPK